MPYGIPKKYVITFIVVVLLIISGSMVAVVGSDPATEKRRADNDQIVDRSDEKVVSTRSTSSIDISHWKTYQNEEYGFEITYPSHYTAELQSDASYRYAPQITEANPVFDLNIHDPEDPGVAIHTNSDDSKVYAEDGFYIALYPSEEKENIQSAIQSDLHFCLSYLTGCDTYTVREIPRLRTAIYTIKYIRYPYFVSYVNRDDMTFVFSTIVESTDEIDRFKAILSTFRSTK